MERISPTTFWSMISFVAAALGGLFILSIAHAGEESHPGTPSISRVNGIELKVASMGVTVEHNSEILKEVKDDLKELRVEQREATENILNALNSRGN